MKNKLDRLHEKVMREFSSEVNKLMRMGIPSDQITKGKYPSFSDKFGKWQFMFGNFELILRKPYDKISPTVAIDIFKTFANRAKIAKK